MPKLGIKQKAFVQEYIKDMNATQAAIRAGYSEKTAGPQASRLLANVNVKAELEKKLGKKFEKLEINGEWVLQQLVDLANKCAGKEEIEIGVIQEGVPLEKRKIFDPSGANSALEKLAKYLKLYTDAGNTVVINNLSEQDQELVEKYLQDK